VTTGSSVLEVLCALEAEGVNLVVCDTNLDHFGLEDQIKVAWPVGWLTS
jgi:hypothetical protein